MNPMTYKKTRMGYAMDAYAAMRKIAKCSDEWCKAFTHGDIEALEQITELLSEAMKEHAEAIVNMGNAEETPNDAT